MVDYSKWDALELSDDSDVEVHPNVDKRSFIRAKQSQIHMERQQRKLQVEALKYERIINDTLIHRLSVLLSALQAQDGAQTKEEGHSYSNPADVAFRAVMGSAPQNPEEDALPPQPEGVFDEDSPPPPPTYSKIMATILDEVNKTLDERRIEKDQRYEAFVEELGMHLRKMQGLQTDLAKKLDGLEQQDSTKITSESYRVGFDSSSVNKGKPSEKAKENTAPELLNPNYISEKADLDTSTEANADLQEGAGEKVGLSPVAKEFAQIKASDYRASHDYISSNPDILQESETDALLIEAFNAVSYRRDEARGWQCVHQAILLQFCRMLGRDGVALFFKRITTPGHKARVLFEKEAAERFQQIREMAKRDAKQQRDAEGTRAVEKIQLHPVEQNTAIQIQVPPAESEDDGAREARAVFERFAPEMRAALESGSLEEVNKVLGEMDVSEAENLVGLLGDAGCLSLENEIIDATTDEGKKCLKDMEEVGTMNTEVAEPTKTVSAKSADDPK